MKLPKQGLMIFLVIIAEVLFPINWNAAGQEHYSFRKAKFYEPVEVPGELLPDLIGTPIENVGVFSYQGGNWSVILSQIDEIAGDGSFVLPLGPENNMDQGNGRLDRKDLLVFMARDAGEKAPEGQTPKGAEKMVQVELIDPLTEKRAWVYVAGFPGKAPVPLQEPYARLVASESYKVRFSTYAYDGFVNTRESQPQPTIFINKMWIYSQAGGNEENIIDRQKIRGVIKFLGGLIEVPINEKVAGGGISALKTGPIRIISHSCMYPILPLGIKGPKFYIDSIMVDTLTLTTTIVKVPFNPKAIITEMTLIFMTDLSPQAKGMYYYNSVNRQGFLIDGKMDEKEQTFKEDKDEWRLITGPQGTQIQYTIFDPKFLVGGKAFSIYNDDERVSHPPENFPGDIGAAADKIVIRNLPAGTYKIITFGCVPSHFYQPGGLDEKKLKEILDLSRSPLRIRASGKEMENQGVKPRQLFKLKD